MSGTFVAALVEVSIRAAALGFLGGVAALVLRGSKAHVRHAVWLAVTIGMLCLPLASFLAPPVPVTIPFWKTFPSVPTPEMIPPLVEGQPARAPTPGRSLDWQAALWAVYAMGAAALGMRSAVGTYRLRRLVSRSRREAVDLTGEVAPLVGIATAAVDVRSSEHVNVPFTAGILRPVILLPAGWRAWPEAKLASVLAHELAHVLRRDSFSARVAALNRCLFWFHPMAWWLEQKLASLAEESADQMALAVVSDSRAYVAAILDFAFAMQAGHLHGMEATAMARSTRVGRRVERILATRHFSLTTLGRGGALLVALCAIPLVFAAAALAPAPQVAASPSTPPPQAGPPEQEVAWLEAVLARDPDNFDAHYALMFHYRGTGGETEMRKHAWWIIEKHPERREAMMATSTLAHLASEGDKTRLRELWQRHAAEQSRNPEVVGNVGQAMHGFGRIYDAEEYFRRARQLAPQAQLHTMRLAVLYSGAFLPGRPAGEWAQFVPKATAELESTPDATLVGSVGEMLIRPYNLESLKMAEKFLQRAIALDGGNERWRRSLAQLKTVQEMKPGEAVAQTPGRIRAGSVLGQNQLLKHVRPVYPPMAKQARIQGTVRLSAVIAKDGTVRDLTVVSGHPLLIPAAMEAARQWVYQPAMLSGEPVEVKTPIDVNFTLNDDQAPAMGGVIGGVTRGVPGGVEGGVPGGRPYRVGDGVTAPTVIRKVEPKFPDALQHQGLTATVVLQIVVGASGRIHNARVLRTDGRREFIEAAIDAVRRWEFEPGRKDGKPVDVEATIEMNFRE